MEVEKTQKVLLIIVALVTVGGAICTMKKVNDTLVTDYFKVAQLSRFLVQRKVNM